MSRARILLGAALLACAPGLAHPQADAPLKHDPFVRPAQVALQRLKPQPQNAGAIAAQETAWNPELKAVMLAGAKSMVDVDGQMVGIGEEIHGHKLLEVRDGEAVFIIGGKRRTVAMRGGAQHIGRGTP